MWGQKAQAEKDGSAARKIQGLVAVAIDKDKGSQHALKWAIDQLLNKGETLILIHVKNKLQSVANPMGNQVAIGDVADDVASNVRKQQDANTKELFLPFRCFCTRKEIHCKDIILEDTDIAKAITEYVAQAAIETLVVGAASRGGFVRRFKSTDIPSSISKGAPDFCTVYVISKGKISSVRSAVRQAPSVSPLRTQIQNQNSIRPEPPRFEPLTPQFSGPRDPTAISNPIGALSYPKRSSLNIPLTGDQQAERRQPAEVRSLHMETESIRSPFARGMRSALAESDISFVSSGRPSTDRSSLYDHLESNKQSRMSNASSDMFDTRSFESQTPHKYNDHSFTSSQDDASSTWSSQMVDDVEAEMKRLKLELKQTMDMYSAACREALSAKQKARELHRWKIEEEQKLEEARLAEEAALAIAEKEKMKCKAAIEAAEAAQRIAELESQKRMNAEMKALKESEEKKKALDALANSDIRYRKYTIEEIEVATEYFAENRKIGEGGYGPVYKCVLDHTHVAIKVLRPDAAQGRTQFQQEVEVLSCIRHPNMVLLLGACPEYGCLVYEYMANGSLEDRLFRRGNTPVLPWQLRFRIAAEIATGLLFLHQSKPEPLVHRDLKPANILIDRNFVSKISDVGLARLVPPDVADHVTQYRMTSTAGTFCYIDPEYQQTGMLGIKSDIYSLGVMLLQIITAKPPMGLTHHVDRSIENGTFADMLDPAVPDWPYEEALHFAKLSLQCAELRRKDRPDLGTVVLPELEKLGQMAEKEMPHFKMGSSNTSPNNSLASMNHDIISDPMYAHSGYNSSRSRSSIASAARSTQ